MTERKGIISLYSNYNFKIIGCRAIEHSARLISELRDPTMEFATVSLTIIIMYICTVPLTFISTFPSTFLIFVVT